MRKQLAIALGLAAAVSLVSAAEAGAATKTQYGALCNAAWHGKHNTKAFRTYKRGCISAAIAAVKAAKTAGDNDVSSANRGRAVAACRAAFPPPRNTHAKRASYRACLSAVTTAEKVYGGRPLTATLTPGTTGDPGGAGTATFTLNQGHGQMCFNVSWTGLNALNTVTEVDIFAVADNSVVVQLNADADLTDGNAKGCENGLTKDTIKAIRQTPGKYYVGVLTSGFATAPGAVSGVLSK
jgi:hypothetical protein